MEMCICDYIGDNSTNVEEMNTLNKEVLSNVKGLYDTFEVINSGNIFDLPKETLNMIKQTIDEHEFKKLFAEAHWIYREHLHKMRQRFEIDMMFKTGVESFDYDSGKSLKKGAPLKVLMNLSNTLIRHASWLVCKDKQRT